MSTRAGMTSRLACNWISRLSNLCRRAFNSSCAERSCSDLFQPLTCLSSFSGKWRPMTEKPKRRAKPQRIYWEQSIPDHVTSGLRGNLSERSGQTVDVLFRIERTWTDPHRSFRKSIERTVHVRSTVEP